MIWKYALLILAIAAGASLLGAFGLHWEADRQAWDAFQAIERSASGTNEVFDPAMVADMPEIARRYFLHAIAPGTPLRTTVRLEMEGKFLLGDKDEFQTYAMTADQILSPPAAFVWMPRMRSGVMEITGSDALVEEEAWTRFWINGLLPVVNLTGGVDLTRSARSRPAMEAVWAPASLLPSNGVTWVQVGPDTAEVAFGTEVEPVRMTLAPNGAVIEVATTRWSDANPDKQYRLQPFGGTLGREVTFEGFTIPTEVSIGNHFRTDNFLPFFQASIRSAEYLPR
jgi:hypothetical protein